MSCFIGSLDMRLMRNKDGELLTNRDGRQMYMLLADFGYSSEGAGVVVTVPAGFVTDLASVPRVPIVYDAFGDMAQEAAVIHDFIYSTGMLPRKTADSIFVEAMEISGVSPWRRYAMYWAIRAFGGGHFGGAGAIDPRPNEMLTAP